MREISVGRFVVREFKGTLADAREFCRGIMVEQIIAFGVGLKDAIKVHMVYYASPPDAVTDDETDAVAVFARTLLKGEEFGYASNFSFAPEAGMRIVSVLGMDRRYGEGATARKAVSEILRKMCMVESREITNLQFVFPLLMEVKTSFEKKCGTHYPVATHRVLLDAVGRVLYCWDMPVRDERSGRVKGTQACFNSTKLVYDGLYDAKSLCRFPGKVISKMRFVKTSNDGVTVHLVFGDGKVTDVALLVNGDTFTPVNEQVVHKDATKKQALAAPQYATV